MSLVLIQQQPNAAAQRTNLAPGRQAVKVVPGTRYEVIDAATGKAPARMVVKRIGVDLVVEVDGEAQLVIQQYFQEATPASAAYFDIHAAGSAADAPALTITQESAPLGSIGDAYVMYAPASDGGAVAPIAGGLGALGWLGVGLLGAGAAYAIGHDNDDNGNVGQPLAPQTPLPTGSTIVTPTDTTAPAAPGHLVTNDADNDGRIEVTGTGEPGATAVVTWPDGTTSEVPVGADGTFTAEAPTPQDPEGEISVTVKDPAGNTSPAATVPAADSLAPDAPADIELGDADGDGLPQASGTAEPGSTVTVTWPDGTTSETTADAQGNWSVESPLAQPNGEVTATATDAAGNTSEPSQAVSYTDTTAPGAPGNLTANDLDNDGLIGVTGTGEPGSTAIVTWPDGTKSEVPIGEDGSFTAEAATPQDPADGDISVVVQDPAGNTGPAETVPAIDLTGPAAPGDLIANDADNDGRIEVTGTGEPGATAVVTWPDGTKTEVPVGEDGTFSVEAPTPQDPERKISVTLRDDTGNTGPAGTVTAADATAPAAPTVHADDSDNNGTTDHLVGTSEPGAEVTVSWPDGSTTTTTADEEGHWSAPLPGPVAEGEKVTVVATDAAGNQSDPTVLTGPLADGGAPAAPGNLVANDGDNDGRIEVTGTGEPGATAVVTWPDGTKSEVPVGADGSFSAEAPTPQDPEGEIAVAIRDDAGNQSEPATVTAQDGVPPAAPSDITFGDGDADGRPTASGQGEPGSSVTVEWPNGDHSTATVKPDGSWTVEAENPQTSGAVSAVATDAARNSSAAASADYIDTTPPAMPSVLVVDDSATNGGTAADDHPSLRGQGEPGSTIHIVWDDNTTSEAVVGADGKWSVESPTAQTTGLITAWATDEAGNQSPSTSVLYRDATKPAAVNETTVAADVDDNTGHGLIYGQTEPGASVEITWPNGETTTAVADKNGHWESESTTPQGIGGDTTVVATDPAGNVSPPTVVELPNWVEPTIQAISGGIGEDGFSTDLASVTVVGTGTPGKEVAVIVNGHEVGRALVDDSGHWEASGVNTGNLLPGQVLTVEASLINAHGLPLPTFGSHVVTKGETPMETIDLSTLSVDTGVIIHGEPGSQATSTTSAGAPNYVAGDFNGDGIDDLLFLSAVQTVEGVTIPNAGYVLFGKDGGGWPSLNIDPVTGQPLIDLATLDPVDGFMLTEAGPGNSFGSIYGIGDFDGDGINDIMVAGGGADLPALGGNAAVSNVGGAYVIYGKDTAAGESWNFETDAAGRSVLRLDTLSPDDGIVVLGTVSGQGLASVWNDNYGDYNGDGLDDIGIPSRIDGITGGSYVIFSNGSYADHLVYDALGRALLLIPQNSADMPADLGIAFAGRSLPSLLDVTGDGIADLSYFSGGVASVFVGEQGKSFVEFGSDGTAQLVTAGFTEIRITDQQNLFANRFLLRDVTDSETLPIVFDTASGSTKVAVLFGITDIGEEDGTGNRVIDLNNLDANHGYIVSAPEGYRMTSMSFIGDVNGDGFEDIGFTTNSVPDNLGGGYVVFGKSDGNGHTVFGDINDQGQRVLELASVGLGDGIAVYGVNPEDALLFSSNVKDLDLNGDGISDLAFRSTANDDYGTDAGVTYVYYGREDLGGTVVWATADNDYSVASNAGDSVSDRGFVGTHLFGLGGNDNIAIANTQFARLAGGDGNGDTLILSGTGLHLDFTTVVADSVTKEVNVPMNIAVTGFEEIEMGYGGDATANVLTIGIDDVLNMSETGSHALYVRGDGFDTVHAGGFAQTQTGAEIVDGVTYDTWAGGGATLYIQQGVIVA